MPVTFVLGRAGTGKTRWCLDALLAALERPPASGRLLLLVPEQASFQMERALVARVPRHGYWQAEVLSFTRLARRAFEETGTTPPGLRPGGRLMALRQVARQQRAVSAAFGSAANTVGFFAQLDRFIEELLLENVTPQQLAQAAGKLTDDAAARRVGALAEVYDGYLAWLGRGRLDPAQQLALLRDRLNRLPWLPETSIWVDGFAGFTGQELETLIALARVAREVTITLLLDPAAPAVRDPARRRPDPLDLFLRTETTYQRLRDRLNEAQVALNEPIELRPTPPTRFANVPALAHLEASLATPIGAGHAPAELDAGPVRVLECETHRDELRAAARFIRRKVSEARGALRFRDFAVIARDLGPLAQLAAEVFDEYGIPYFLDQRRPLAAHALVRFVRALLEVLAEDFATAATTRLLRSGLLPLRRESAERLENLLVRNEIRGADVWKLPEWSFDRISPSVERARQRIVAGLGPLLDLAAHSRPVAAADWARALHESLTKLRVDRRIAGWVREAQRAGDWETAEVHRLAWDSLCELLEDLHDTFADQPLELTELAAVIDAALGELTVGLAPPTLDQVLISSIERSRHPDIRHAWVFAFNDGMFPARPGADLLLSAAEREVLEGTGLAAPRSRRNDAFVERMFAYIALTRPSDGLTISYAKLDENGEPLFPSPMLADVLRALPMLRPERPDEDGPPVCLAEFVRGYLRTHAAGTPTPARYAALRDALESSPTAAPELARLLRGLAYRNSPAPVGNYRRPRAGGNDIAWDGSPSELDSYLACPFQHFAHYGLRLDAARGPDPPTLELGRHAHEILAAVTRRALESGQRVAALSDEQWLSFLEAAQGELAGSSPPELAACRPRMTLLKRALGSFLRELVLVHAARWRRGCFEPIGCEMRFGGSEEGALRPLELTTADGRRIRLHGFIDRLDRCEHGGTTYLLVYDYKSSQVGSIRNEYLIHGNLQLFAYLLAVEQSYARSGACVAGVLLAPLYPDTAVLETRYFQEAPDAEKLMYLYRPRGLFDADVAALLDRELGAGRSPVAAVALKADGSFTKDSDAQPREELTGRLELARRTILLAAGGIIDGRIDVAPLLDGRNLACQWCEFGPLCRHEAIFNRPRVLERSLPLLSEVGADEEGGRT